MNPKIAEVVNRLRSLDLTGFSGIGPYDISSVIDETIESLQAVAQPREVVVDEAMVERAREVYSDTYDAEYKLHGPVDNHSTALRAALTATLASGEGK